MLENYQYVGKNLKKKCKPKNARTLDKEKSGRSQDLKNHAMCSPEPEVFTL